MLPHLPITAMKASRNHDSLMEQTDVLYRGPFPAARARFLTPGHPTLGLAPRLAAA